MHLLRLLARAARHPGVARAGARRAGSAKSRVYHDRNRRLAYEAGRELAERLAPLGK